MSYKNKKDSINVFDRKWGINKNHKQPKFNRSMFKTTSKLSTFFPIKKQQSPSRQIIKTQPDIYQRSPSPSIKPILRNSTQYQQNPEVPSPFCFTSIQQAEARVDLLLKEKLKLLVSLNKQKFFNKSKNIKNISTVDSNLATSIIKLNSQIQLLIESVKINMNDPRFNQNIQKWGQLDKKIKMLEKVMAQNTSQAQVLKKYYAKVSNNITTYKNFSREPHGVLITKIKNALSMPKQKKTSFSPSSRFGYQSINNSSYKLPGVDDYQKYRYKQPQPDNDKDRIIDRSAYNTSYRPFKPPVIPYSISRRHSSLSIRPPSRQSISTYKDQYKPLKEKLINFKQLDCYKDKFKRLQISFSNKRSQYNTQQVGQYIKLQKFGIKSNALTQSNTIYQTIPTPRSISHIDYKSMQNKQRKMYAVKPKNNRLDSLRTSFKRLINED